MGMFFSRVSIRLSFLLAQTPLTPNQLTIMSTAVALLGTVMVQDSNYLVRVLGIVVWFFGYILDFADGEIARHKRMETEFGHWFDGVTDRIKDFGLYTAMTVLAARTSESMLVVVTGLMALGGAIVYSYASTYGFKATSVSVGPLDRFGNIYYGLMAVFIVLDRPFVFLAIVAFSSLGALALSICSTLIRSHARPP